MALNGIETINLEKIILELKKTYSGDIRAIYLFGSRGYKTNSIRSDIDLIFFHNGEENLVQLKAFLKKHIFLDIFVGNNSRVHSVSNDSVITLRNKQKSLIKQLDAVLLWDCDNGFCLANKDYLKQQMKTGVKLYPSSFDTMDNLISIKKFLKNQKANIDDRQHAFLREAINCYESNNYLAFIAMIGGYLETLLLSLLSKYENRVSSKFSSMHTFYRNNISDTSRMVSIKTRLEQFLVFIKNNDSSFGTLYFSNEKNICTFLETTFDVARRYRNNVDHCLEYQYDDNICDQIALVFHFHVPSTVNAICQLSIDPSK